MAEPDAADPGTRYPAEAPSAGRPAGRSRGWPGESVPICWPASTACPASTIGVSGSYVVRSPPAWSTLTTPRPATGPANATTPGPAATTASPERPERSTPRCPGSHGCGGGSNPRTTANGSSSGQTQEPATSPDRPGARAESSDTDGTAGGTREVGETTGGRPAGLPATSKPPTRAGRTTQRLMRAAWPGRAANRQTGFVDCGQLGRLWITGDRLDDMPGVVLATRAWLA